jgi:NADPH2:quinone reductase
MGAHPRPGTNGHLGGAGYARVQFETFGDPSVLELAEVATPAVGARMALVRIMAASINPSHVKNVEGAMKQTTLPRIPGRDYAGRVEAGPAEWIGAEVWGTGGDTGFTRDGTHAELIAVPVESLRRKPNTLSFDQAASVGVNCRPLGAASKRQA